MCILKITVDGGKGRAKTCHGYLSVSIPGALLRFPLKKHKQRQNTRPSKQSVHEPIVGLSPQGDILSYFYEHLKYAEIALAVKIKYEAKVCKYGHCKDLNIRGRAFSDPYRGDGVVSLQLEMDRRSAKVGTAAKKILR